MTNIQRLEVVSGGKPRRSASQAEQIFCRACEADTGIATSHFIEDVVAPRSLFGRLLGKSGSRKLLCVPCLARGKTTRVTP